MRYNVGEKYAFIQVTWENKTDDGRFFTLYNPYHHKNPVIEIKVLEVKEHHKVAVSFREEEDKTADGFLLAEEDGTLWANQYPVASYGQLDDSNDRIVRRYISNEDFEQLSEEDKNLIAAEFWTGKYVDALNFVKNIEKALRDPKFEIGEHREEFEKYRDDVKVAIETAMGKKLDFRPHVFRNTKTGEEKTIPTIIEAYYL